MIFFPTDYLSRVLLCGCIDSSQFYDSYKSDQL